MELSIVTKQSVRQVDASAATAALENPGANTLQWAAGALANFAALPKRWIVERTFAWLMRNRRLARDWERLSATTETWIYLAMSRLMTKRLAHATT